MTKFWLDQLKPIYWSFPWVRIHSIFKDSEVNFTITFWYTPPIHAAVPYFNFCRKCNKVLLKRQRSSVSSRIHPTSFSRKFQALLHGKPYKLIQTRDLNIMHKNIWQNMENKPKEGYFIKDQWAYDCSVRQMKITLKHKETSRTAWIDFLKHLPPSWRIYVFLVPLYSWFNFYSWQSDLPVLLQ